MKMSVVKRRTILHLEKPHVRCNNEYNQITAKPGLTALVELNDLSGAKAKDVVKNASLVRAVLNASRQRTPPASFLAEVLVMADPHAQQGRRQGKPGKLGHV